MKTETKKTYIEEIKQRISKEMPRVIQEIKVYERKLKNGELTTNPKVSPQFNG
jgi:hypothetical protein